MREYKDFLFQRESPGFFQEAKGETRSKFQGLEPSSSAAFGAGVQHG
jgi:hypothetical protein